VCLQLDERRLARGFVVEAQDGFDFHAVANGIARPPPQQAFGAFLAEDHAADGILEFVDDDGVHFEGVEGVGEDEEIEHFAAAVAEGFGLEDVHAEAGEATGEVGEQARAVPGDDGQLPVFVTAAQIAGNTEVLGGGGQPQMFKPLRFVDAKPVAGWEAFDKAGQFRVGLRGGFDPFVLELLG